MKNLRKKRKRTVLITGGAGFIGSNLAGELLRLGFRVIVFDNLSTGKYRNIKEYAALPNFVFIKGNVNEIRALSSVFRNYKIDYVYHYAACVGVKRTLDNPLIVLSDIDGLKNVLRLAVKHQVKRFLFSSSSEVYGESIGFPQDESSTPLNSKLPYAVVKNFGEALTRSYGKEYGLKYTIFRFFNTYGPKQSDNFVISRFILQALDNKPITVNGSGGQSRSYMFIDDNIRATASALLKKESVNKTINIGNDEELSVNGLAKMIIRLTNSGSKIIHLPALPEGDMLRRVPDISLMKKILNYQPAYRLEDGLKKTIDYYRKIYDKSSVYVVIPAYNEEKRLPDVLKRIKDLPLSQVIVVDDGSKKPIRDFLPQKVIVARHIVNLGKGMALKTGCDLAMKLGAKKIILMDADGQHDPKEIPIFIDALNDENDVIFGAREIDKKMPYWRKLGNRLLNRFAGFLFKINLNDIWCGYRAFNSSIYPKIIWNSSDYSSDVEMVINVGLNNIKHKEQYVGTIYLDKASTTSTTLQDGIKLLFDLIIWRIKKL